VAPLKETVLDDMHVRPPWKYTPRHNGSPPRCS
jgi:hypothetical protein